MKMKNSRKIIRVGEIKQDRFGKWFYITDYVYQGIDEHKSSDMFKSAIKEAVENSRNKALEVMNG